MEGAYITFLRNARSARQVEVEDGVVLDYTADGELMGIELLREPVNIAVDARSVWRPWPKSWWGAFLAGLSGRLP